jgi:hypothetical protein
MTPLDAAISYARLGLPVLPLWSVKPGASGLICACGKEDCSSPGKHPNGWLAPQGAHSATLDEQLIRRWWRTRPTANVGIAAGCVLVLDIDPRKNGDRSLAELERRHGALPPTWRVITGGAGTHIYFAAPATSGGFTNTASKIAPGIDVRTRGGLVAAPPSRHVSGRAYVWDRAPDAGPIANLPAWLAALIAPPPRPQPRRQQQSLPTDSSAKLNGIIRTIARAKEGERNCVAYWGACRLAEMVTAGNLTRNEALALAVEAASRAGLPRHEALSTAQSGLRNSPP